VRYEQGFVLDGDGTWSVKCPRCRTEEDRRPVVHGFVTPMAAGHCTTERRISVHLGARRLTPLG
jgi:hypothetical protein